VVMAVARASSTGTTRVRLDMTMWPKKIE
jgi:hypothetical protein